MYWPGPFLNQSPPPLRVILAYEQDGEPLAYEDGGPLRLVVITESPDVITEGRSEEHT
ncbi:MAG: molybdopterin-dependent oxidoreductase, partial [Bacilli bacterium]|nr:molybdopterin-dependent oxidoreductase [Bacilli bacterium]